MTTQTTPGAAPGSSRRAFLRNALATLPIAAGLPPAAAAALEAGTRRLRELIAEWTDQKALVRSLNSRDEEVRKIELQRMADPPAALCRRRADTRLLRFLNNAGVAVGEPYTRKHVEMLTRRRMQRVREVPIRLSPEGRPGEDFAPGQLPTGTMGIDYGTRLVAEPWPLAQARADAIVAAQAVWDQECAELRERLGMQAIEEALNEAYDRLWDLENQLDAFTPRSTEELQVKARFAVEHLYCDGASAEHTSDIFAWNVLRAVAELPV